MLSSYPSIGKTFLFTDKKITYVMLSLQRAISVVILGSFTIFLYNLIIK